MADKTYTRQTSKGDELTIYVKRDGRLRKSAKWVRQEDGIILLRVPKRTPQRHVDDLLVDVIKQVEQQADQRRQIAARRTDATLQKRAEAINNECFNGELEWTAIRWVSNMRTRLGSCTTGGPTDGHIRISERIKDWPEWVVDYVIAHELAHRKHPNHSEAFWTYLQTAYPLTERARGFIEGVAYGRGEDLLMDDGS